MYCLLGNIAFEPVDITAFDEAHEAEFAEHSVLKGKPRLQAMGEKLNTLNFSLRLHHQLGGVESRYQALLSAKAKQETLALIWGRGKYKGNYVIVSLDSTTLFTDKQGNVLSRELRLSLKECAEEEESRLLGAALNLGGGTLLGAILPSGVVSTLSEAKQVVSRGITLYQQGKRVVDEVKNNVAVMRQFASEPALAFTYLPDTLNALNNALGYFAEAAGLNEALSSLQAILPNTALLGEELGNIYHDLQTMQSSFVQAGTTGWENWFTPADNALSRVNERVDNLAKPVADMTAWIVLRRDESNPLPLNRDNEGENADTNLS